MGAGNTLLSALGISRWMGLGFLVMAFVVGASAFGTWLRDDALEQCNSTWELKLGAASRAAAAQQLTLQAQLSDLSLRLQAAESTSKELQLVASQQLEKQRAEFALSKDCDLCRIPNSHLWVRSSSTGGPASATDSGKTGGNTASSKVPKAGN